MVLHDKECKKNICWGKVVPLLYKMGTTITNSNDLHETIMPLLKIMNDNMGVIRGMFTLFTRKPAKFLSMKASGSQKKKKSVGFTISEKELPERLLKVENRL